MDEIRLVERDYQIFNEINRWRVCGARHIQKLCNFKSYRTCDRRLHKLLQAGYLERKKYLYGVPYLYHLTYSAKLLIGSSLKKNKIKLEQIHHDMTVLDVAIYFNSKYRIPFENIKTEKQLHQQDGFGIRKHKPDFIFIQDNKSICVEVELTVKSKSRLEDNIKSNFMQYDKQIWFITDINNSISNSLKEMQPKYPIIEIISLSEIKG